MPDSGSAAFLKALAGESSEKVHSLRAFLCASESSHKKADSMQAVLAGRKVELLDILPQEAVVDVRDVFDVMTPAEITDWVQEASLRYCGGSRRALVREQWGSGPPLLVIPAIGHLSPCIVVVVVIAPGTLVRRRRSLVFDFCALRNLR